MRHDFTPFQEIRAQFEMLKVAVVDASSMIYLQKIGCYNLVPSLLLLYTTQKVIAEIGFESPHVTILNDTSEDSTDTSVLNCARLNKCAIISEDRALLLRAQKISLQFYNTLLIGQHSVV